MHKAVIRLTSVTYAIRAQKILERRGIRSIIKKTTKNLHNAGCGYGLEVALEDANIARGIIASSGIRIIDGNA